MRNYSFIKVTCQFFRMYDYYLNKYEGVQYYGTLGDKIPLKDSETFQERKDRLHL